MFVASSLLLNGAVAAASDDDAVDQAQPSDVAEATDQVPSDPLAAGGAGGGSGGNGIRVHGQWTIEVFEPTGELVSRSEIQNAYDPDFPLARLMARELSFGRWSILLDNTSLDNKPCLVDTSPQPCLLAENGSLANTGPNVFKNLTVDVPDAGADVGKLVFAGVATAQRTGSVVSVATRNHTCPATDDPATPCDSAGLPGRTFTATNITPIPVVANQQIQVTVRISFSSGS